MTHGDFDRLQVGARVRWANRLTREYGVCGTMVQRFPNGKIVVKWDDGSEWWIATPEFLVKLPND